MELHVILKAPTCVAGPRTRPISLTGHPKQAIPPHQEQGPQQTIHQEQLLVGYSTKALSISLNICTRFFQIKIVIVGYIYIGKYIYIETSAPRRRGDKARILSPQVPGGSPLCFQFYYHMYGPHIGTLNVFVKSVALNGSQTVWTKSLNQGNKWVLGEVTIPQVYTNYQVRYGCLLIILKSDPRF